MHLANSLGESQHDDQMLGFPRSFIVLAMGNMMTSWRKIGLTNNSVTAWSTASPSPNIKSCLAYILEMPNIKTCVFTIFDIHLGVGINDMAQSDTFTL